MKFERVGNLHRAAGPIWRSSNEPARLPHPGLPPYASLFRGNLVRLDARQRSRLLRKAIAVRRSSTYGAATDHLASLAPRQARAKHPAFACSGSLTADPLPHRPIHRSCGHSLYSSDLVRMMELCPLATMFPPFRAKLSLRAKKKAGKLAGLFLVSSD